MADERRDALIGRVLHGTIKIVRLIGQGGMGSVYEGYQEHLERRVAVKVMTAAHARNPMAAEYFIREAKQSSKLRHPNIIQILDYGKEGDDTLFIAMEYVPGRTLSDLLKEEWPLPAERVISILDQTLAGLEIAHDNKVVHRDLKPDNLMIEATRDGRDFVKVLDFGIAQSTAPGSTLGPLTQAGALVGTPHYMSPEQAQGDSVDHRSDLFSMGAIMYEILTNQRPFVGKGVPQILIAVISSDPPSPTAAAPDTTINPYLEAICLRAMHKDIDLRYQSATDFRRALKEITKPQAQEKEAPAQFIFKRSKLKDGSSDDQAGIVRNNDLGEDAVGTMAVQPKELGSRSEATQSEERRQRSDLLIADTQALHGGIGSGESEVVDISQLFASEASVAQTSPPVPQTDLEISTEQARHEAKRPAAKSSVGLDLDELRGDLIGEKRPVAALVVHQRAHKRLDSEQLMELNDLVTSRLSTIVEKWGGTMHSRQGSFTTILFGLTNMAADDPFRAAQAALELRTVLRRETPEEIGFAFALAHGEVFCPSGDVERAAGAPLDNASDAVHGIGDHEVLSVGEPFQQQLETTFRLGPAYSDGTRPVLGIFDVSAQPRTRSSDLVGRESELAAILGMLGRVSRANGGTTVVTGEPGMGKSAVISRGVEQAEQRGMFVLHAEQRFHGPEGVRSMMLQWLHDLTLHFGRVSDVEVMLRELGLGAEYTRVLSGFMHNNLKDVMGSTGAKRSLDSATSASSAVQVSFRALLRILTDDRPIIMLLDQVDDYDDELARFLNKWSRFAEKEKVGFIVGFRVDAGQTFPDFPRTATLIHMDPLDEAACRAYLKANLPQTVPAQLRAMFVRLSAGIPQHLAQLVKYAKEKKTLSLQEAEAWLGDAKDIAGVLQLRLFGLPKSERNTMALLSVLGNGTLGEVLLDLANEDWQPERVLQSLYSAGLLNIHGTENQPILDFNPPSFQRVIYNQLSRKMRHRVHARAAEYFKQRIAASRSGQSTREDRIQLLAHLEATSDAHGALVELETLIEESLAGFEYESAEDFIRRAIVVVESSQDVAEVEVAHLKLQMVRIYDVLGRSREAVDLTRELDRMKGVPPILAIEIRLELANLWLNDEDPDLIERIAKRVIQDLHHLKETDPHEPDIDCMMVKALQLMGGICERQARYVQAANNLLQAIEITERGGIDIQRNPWGPRLIWEPLNQLGRVRIRTRELAGAGKLFELALRIAHDAEDPRGEISARGNLATLLAEQNRLDAANRSLLTALKLARRSGDLRAVAKLLHNLGLLLLRQKRASQASKQFEASLELSNDLDWREGIAMNTSQIASMKAVEEKASFMKPGSR